MPVAAILLTTGATKEEEKAEIPNPGIPSEH